MSQVQTAAVVHAMDERIHDKENAAPMGGDAKQGAVPRVLRSGGAMRTAPTSATTEMAPTKISPSPLQVRAGCIRLTLRRRAGCTMDGVIANPPSLEPCR